MVPFGQRLLHRRAAKAQPDMVEKRYTATACGWFELDCTEVPAFPTDHTPPGITFPPGFTTTSPSSTASIPTQTVHTPDLPTTTTSTSTTPALPSTTSTSSTSTTTTSFTTLSSLPTTSFSSTSTVVLTQTLDAASAATSSTAASGGVSTGTIIGGIGGSIVGIAVLSAIISFFLRRWRKRRDENEFNSADFRRSAVLLPDSPTQQDLNSGFGYNPNMTEAPHRSRPASFGTMYGAAAPSYASSVLEIGAMTDVYAAQARQYQFSHMGGVYPQPPPGLAFASPPSPLPNAYTPGPVPAPNPFLAGTPVSDAQAPVIETGKRQSSNSAAGLTGLTRKASVKEDETDIANRRASEATIRPATANDYVDLNRSGPATEDAATPVDRVASPFEDHTGTQVLEFPAPPAISQRIDSSPPKLPEIHIAASSRASELFSASSMGTFEFPSPPNAAPAPSVAPAQQGVTASATAGATPLPATPTTPKAATSTVHNERPVSVLFSEDDAYGGI